MFVNITSSDAEPSGACWDAPLKKKKKNHVQPPNLLPHYYSLTARYLFSPITLNMMFYSCYKINISYLFSNIILSTASGQLMHLWKNCPFLASAGLLQFTVGVCPSELHPRGLKATRSTVADSGDRLVKLIGGVFFKALTQPIALPATIRGGSPDQNIRSFCNTHGKEWSGCFVKTLLYFMEFDVSPPV